MQEDEYTLRVRSGSVASLRLNWATMSGILLGPITCLPHEKGGIPIKCLAQGHNKQACRLVLHTIPMVLSAKQGSCEYHF